ncbi:hypothetical protein [Poseidonibacter lekithochrous]|uniref:hypothetical protein n=1 Tax=Poseidonibacter lekithochrous TaxID=1904463 RepID=UPI000D3AF138|nr:hypothetical protein [Poseidonibacter lekithochrous]
MPLEQLNDKLQVLIEEIEKVRRRKIIDYENNDNIQYLDPFNNLGKVKISNNHLVLGRRGSGKTTLLISAIKEDSDNFMLPIDCQVFRDFDANKVIIEILKQIVNGLLSFIDSSKKFNNSKEEYNKKKNGICNFIKNIFITDSNIYDYEKYIYLKTLINSIKLYLEELKKLPDENIKINIKSQKTNKENQKIENKEENKIIGKIKAEGKASTTFINLESDLDLLTTNTYIKTNENVSEKEHSENSEYDKIINKKDKLYELIYTLSEIMSEFTKTSEQRTVLYLDDFYLVNLNVQPIVIQFFHDIYKNSKYNSFCFKICSIPNRTRLNVGKQVDFSIKDDFSPIRLDKELNDFLNLKDFLLRITSNLNPNLDISSNDINSLFNNEEVLNYAIVSTGGVARDFLVNLAELIKIAKTDNSTTIKKEHLYSAISASKEDKLQNIEIESDISSKKLRLALEVIKKEVVDSLKTNIILYPFDLAKEHELLLKNLVNLRYLHVINEQTSSKRKNDTKFTSYLIDMTFYATGKRLKQGFKFRRIWADDSEQEDEIRNSPIWSFSDDFVKLEN